MIDPLLLTAARVLTYEGQRPLTNASSFFFERDERLFLVISRHVMIDEASQHFPDRMEIELHIEPDLSWMLLGVHSARLDVDTRDLELDEALGLNCAWYADILLTLTER